MNHLKDVVILTNGKKLTIGEYYVPGMVGEPCYGVCFYEEDGERIFVDDVRPLLKPRDQRLIAVLEKMAEIDNLNSAIRYVV